MKLFLIILLAFLVVSCGNKNSAEKKQLVKGKTEILKDSLALYPDSLIFRENLVQHYRDSGQYELAINETKKGIERDSMNARLYEMLAILQFEREDTTAAIAAFEHAVSIAPVPQYMISLGTMYAQTKNKQALPLMDVLVREYPKFKKEAAFVRGLYLSQEGNYRAAINEFDTALNVSFTFMEAYREKSIALYKMGLYDKALEVIDKAVTLQNNYEEGYYYKGKVLEKLNRSGEAMEAYRTALLYAPDYIEAREALTRLEKNVN